MHFQRSFTLIELLIVVAIIAILAAIAIPNFLDAQTRAKVSRVKADFRTIATALESYCTDQLRFPPSYAIGNEYYTAHLDQALFRLTTPVAYISTTKFPDPFGRNLRRWYQTMEGGYVGSRPMYMYINYEPVENVDPEWMWRVVELHFSGDRTIIHRAFILKSSGPDMNDDGIYWAEVMDWSDPASRAYWANSVYDVSNGTLSRGDIGRLGGEYRCKGLFPDQ